MKTITCTENISWEETLRQAEQEEVLLMRDGHAVALLIPFDDDDLEWYARERDPAFLLTVPEFGAERIIDGNHPGKRIAVGSGANPRGNDGR